MVNPRDIAGGTQKKKKKKKKRRFQVQRNRDREKHNHTVFLKLTHARHFTAGYFLYVDIHVFMLREKCKNPIFVRIHGPFYKDYTCLYSLK